MDTKVIYSMVGVGKTYPPSKQVLRDISLSYFYGAKIGVIGLNGAGKSTLLRIMAGVEKAFNGETILAPGYTIGYLEQEPVLDDAKTVRAIVEEGPRGSGAPALIGLNNFRQSSRLENGPETRLPFFSIAYQPSLMPRMLDWCSLM